MSENYSESQKPWSKHDFGSLMQKIEGGGTPARDCPNYWNGNIPWATVKDLTDTYLKRTEESISELGLKQSSSKLIPANTIIIATRMAVGRVVVFNKDVAINQDLKAVFPKDALDSIFLLYWFQEKSYYFESIGVGSTVKGIRLEEINAVPVSLPPLPEQQKIASILTSVDTVIEKTEAQINKLKDLKKAMMQELLTKGIGHTEFKDSPVGRIPVEWDINILGDKISLLAGYAFQSKDFVNKGIPLIRMGNLFGNKLDLNRSSIYVPISFLKLHSIFCISQGDLIMSMTGTVGKEDYGYVVQIPANTPTALLNQRVSKIIPSAYVDSNFILHLMRSRLFLNRIFTIGAGTKQANLSSSQILSVQLPFPPLLEQQKIASTLSSIGSNIKENQNKLSHTKSLKKALMQDLLTGKVRVSLN